jgi:hypothetical protein
MKKEIVLLILASLSLMLLILTPQVSAGEDLEYVYPTIESSGIQLNATAYRLHSGDTINLTFSFTTHEFVNFTLLEYYNYYGESEKESYVNATFYIDGVYGGYFYRDIGPDWASGRSRSKVMSFLLPGTHVIEWKWLFKVHEDGEGYFEIDFYGVKLILQKAKTATIDIDPNTLNLKSKGKWITCYIELPEGYNVSDFDRAIILLNGTIPVDPFWMDKQLESVVGDYDDDGIPDLMVKFDRTSVIDYILDQNMTYKNVTLTVTGIFQHWSTEIPPRHWAIFIEGSDTIRVRMPDDVNCDDEDYLIAPEFPSFLILPLFMMSTLLAVIVYRRKYSQTNIQRTS